jgi:hypothetical protein
MTNEETKKIDSGHCPVCDHRGFVLGPRGGASMNIECGNLACRARFNVAQFSTSHRIVFAQRIPRQSEGGADWT